VTVQQTHPTGTLGRPVVVLAIVVVAGLAMVAMTWQSDYFGRVLALIALAIMAATGLNIVTGATGQMSLGHAGFYAIGAYITASLSVHHGWPIAATIPVAIVVNAVVGLALAWPALRLSGPYLTMVTVAFGLIIHSGAVDFPKLTNGPEGLFPVPGLSIGGDALSLHAFNVVLILVAALIVFIQASLFSSRFGRAMRAVRGNELAADALGVPVVAIKCFAFALSGALAGVAGAFFAPLNGYVNPDGFSLDLSVQLLLMVILGGIGTVWGPVAGAILLVLLDRALSDVGDTRLIIYGLMLVVLIYIIPEWLDSISDYGSARQILSARLVPGMNPQIRV
jgi:ABC-type branched-subunit amino acid transport system permease subunit